MTKDRISELDWADPNGAAVMATQYQARWLDLVQTRDRICLLGMALLQARWVQITDLQFRIDFPDGSTWHLERPAELGPAGSPAP